MQQKWYKRIISGVLASLFAVQLLVYGDAGNNGLVMVENIKAVGNAIEQQINSKALKAEFDEAVGGLGEVDYFNIAERGLFRSASLQSSGNNDEIVKPDGLTINGYVGQYGTYSDLSKVKILIFNDWTLVDETYAQADGSFYISVAGLGTSTNIKIECDGYMPRFYRSMGHGSYQFGTADNPEMLYPGDTTYNENESNRWSDEQITSDDADYVYGFIGLRDAKGNYDSKYDFNNDRSIDPEDLALIEEHYCENTDDEKYLLEMDLNLDGKIDVDDYDLLNNGPHKDSYAGDEDFKPYMDKDNDGEIDASDYQWFVDYCSQYEGYTSGANYIYNVKLTGDCYIDTGTWQYNTNLDLNGYTMAINGNLAFMTSNLNLLDGVILNINGGRLLINGEFYFGQAQSYDRLIMTNDADVLMVTKNWYYTTLFDCEGSWTAGIILFYGQHWNVNEGAGYKCIYSSGTHQILFYNPYGKQTILWDNPNTYINNEDGSLNTLRTYEIIT